VHLGKSYFDAKEMKKKLAELDKKIDVAKKISDELQGSVGYLKVLQDFYLRESFAKTAGLVDDNTSQINHILENTKLSRKDNEELIIKPKDLINELEQRWAISELFNPNIESHYSALDLLYEQGNSKLMEPYLKEYLKNIDNDKLRDKVIKILAKS